MAAVFLAVSLVAILACVGFALELGQLYFANTDLRKQAEMAALDTVMAAGGCLSPAVGGSDRQLLATEAATGSLIRNAAGGAQLEGAVVLGEERVNGAERVFAPLNPVTNAHAASVVVSRPLPPALVPMLPRPEGARMQATAQATRAPIVGLSVGSYGADLDTSQVPLLNDLFSALLGEPLILGAASYEGLLESSIELADLVAVLGVTTLEQLLSEPITLPGLLQLLVDALVNSGDAVSAAAVGVLADAAPATGTTPVGQMLGLPDDLPESAQAARIGVFDAVRGATMQAQPVFALTPEIDIPNLVTVRATVELIRPAERVAGPVLVDESGRLASVARNQQANVNLDLGIQPVGLDLANLRLQITAAEAEAALLDTHCGSVDDPEDRVDVVAETRIASLRIDDSEPLLNLTLDLPIVGAVAARVFASAEVEVGDDRVHGPRTFVGPFSAEDPVLLAANTWRVSSEVGGSVSGALSSLAQNLSLRTEVDLPTLGPVASGIVNAALGPLLNGIVATVAGTLDGLLNQLDGALLNPLLETVGLSLGGADVVVYQFEVPRPTLIASQ